MAAPWDRRSPAEQARVQGLAAARWLPSVVRFSGHWSKVAAQLHLEAEALKGVSDVQAFPTSRERELISQVGPGAPGLVLRPTEEQIKGVATTSTLMSIAGALRKGGQGAMRRALLEEYKPVHVHRRDDDGIAVASSRRDLDRMHLAGARAASVMGLDDGDYLVSAVPAGPTLAFWGTYHLGLGASMLALHPRGHQDGLDAVVASFQLQPTTVIVVPVEEAVDLALLLGAEEARISRVATVVVLGPVPDDQTRSDIAEAYAAAGAPADVAVLAMWGPPDARCLWAEQRAHPGALVTYPDLDLVEVVDPLTGLVTDGAGDLTISSIGWTGTAMVRYQTGSWVGGLDDTIDEVTGRTMMRLVGGQQEDAWSPTVTTADGPRRIDLRGVAAVVGPHPSVQTWLFEMRGATQRIRNDRLVLELGGDVADQQLAAIEAALPDALGIDGATIKVSANPNKIAARVDEAQSHFVDLR